jgi:citrate lyase subunit beta/citryl-CoA lyase
MLNARIHQPDAVILDLEDSVPAVDKDAALLVVRNALYALDARISSALSSFGDRRSSFDVFLMPIIETCEGMFRAREIAGASPRVIALTYGLEDYILDLDGIKTPARLESLWARSQVANAAKAASVQAIDTVFADIEDMDALRASCRAAKELGFEGKGCIHPRQIPVVNEEFTPSAAEIDKAQSIVLAFKEAQAQGRNVVSVGSKMIDPPVVARAQRTIAMAEAMGSRVQGSTGSGPNPGTPGPQNPSES